MSSVKGVGTLLEPIRPETLPKGAQWLAGQGAGTWFSLTSNTDFEAGHFRVQRFSPQGEIECDRMMRHHSGPNLDPNNPYQFTWISHCQKCTILQGEAHIELIFSGKDFL